MQTLLLHWLVMGVASALATMGYFMLFELFWQIGRDLKPLVGLVGLTGLPIALDILASVSPQFIEITYEPLGVAAFAVGMLYVYLDDFQAIQLAGEADDPIIGLNGNDHVRDYNVEATDLFPDLTMGRPSKVLAPN